jgi:beta-glucosidase/6-phospho-beta-glucosidase/beta-galactosidase
VAQAMAAAHGAMAQAIHAEDADAQVGVVINVGQTFPKDPDRPADVTAAEHMAYLYNELIPGLFIDGRVDSNLDGEQDGTLEGVAGQTDWLGLNYYFSFEVIGLGISAFPGYAYMDFFPETLITDVEYLGDAIDISAAYGLPLWITENGIANPTADHPDSFVTPALRITQAKALEHDLHGYLYWSLVDNYEWNHGMGMTFGLYEVDLDTKARTLRPIGERFGQIAGDHGVPALEE